MVYGAKRDESGMLWDDGREMYLNIAAQYGYVVVPAMCVTNEDVLEIVYKLPSEDGTNFKSLRTLTQPMRQTKNRQTFHLHFCMLFVGFVQYLSNC